MRMTVGGNLITDYPGETSTESAALETIKIHWNHTLSTAEAKSMTMDIKNMYLNTKLDRYEYMKVHINLIPKEIIALHNLRDKVGRKTHECVHRRNRFNHARRHVLCIRG